MTTPPNWIALALPVSGARPQRLVDFADTVVAIREALMQRAGWLTDTWEDYQHNNGAEWRTDFGDLPGALRAWAQTVGALGEWTGQVGNAFLDADDADGGDVHFLLNPRLRDLLPSDAAALLDTADPGDVVDWGTTEEPPEWLEHLRTAQTAVGQFDQATGTVDVAYVVGTGSNARWQPMTPALLGRFASARSVARFSRLLGPGAAAASGFVAGLDQWLGDAGTLNYSDGEAAARAGTRGVGTAMAIGGFSYAASFGASALCGPGAPVCAGVVIVGVGLSAGLGVNGIFDFLMPSPRPAEHDADMVYDEILGLEPGYHLSDMSDTTREVLFQAHHATHHVTPAPRQPFLDTAGFDPAMAEQYDLPLGWIRDHHGDDAADAVNLHRALEAAPDASPLTEPLEPEVLDAIEEHEESLAP